MRLLSALFAFVSFLAGPCFAQSSSSGLTRYIETQLYPILWTYEACAIRHLRSAAGAYSGTEFDDHELTIKRMGTSGSNRLKIVLGFSIKRSPPDVRVVGASVGALR
jgi:hypothetical protein